MSSDTKRPTRRVHEAELESSVRECVRSSTPTHRVDEAAAARLELMIPPPPRLPVEVRELRNALDDSAELDAVLDGILAG